MQQIKPIAPGPARTSTPAWAAWSPAAAPTILFAGLAAAAVLFAFIGLGVSSYWTDELFTLFVIDHRGGLAEVLRRALTDTHPPAYYFMLYGWSRLLGLSEPAIRLFSALCAVGAAGVFFVSMRGVFSLTARCFALAMGLNATFWFDQAQNARSYSVCMLASALLLSLALAARRQVRAGSCAPTGPLIGLVAVGAVGSFCHAYVFLEVGLVYLFLVATVPCLRLRIVLVAAGLAIAAGYGAYSQALLHATRQDVHNMWFRNDPVFFFNQITVAWRVVFGVSGWIAAALLAFVCWRRRGERAQAGDGARGEHEERRWVGTLGAVGHVGTILAGIAVSLAVAPSMSSLNLATASPLLWAVMAWLYDVGGPRLQTRNGRIFAAVLALAPLAHLGVLPGRFLAHNEDWRGSARFVAASQACAGQPIPVVLPRKFGPPTPFFRSLAQQQFYGRYFAEAGRLHAYLPDELAGRTPVPGLTRFLAARAQAKDVCPILAWGVHDLPPEDAQALRADLERLPGVAPMTVEMKPFGNFAHEELGYSRWAAAFVYLAVPPPRP